MKRLFSILFLTLVLPCLALSADIRAFVDRTVLAPEESIQFTITSKGSEATIDISPIKDFQVMSRGTSSSVQIINGQVSREVTYNYILLPLREGQLTIPALTVITEGETSLTQEIRVTVTQKPQRQDITDPVFAEATVSDATPYVGQQIIYTFKLFRQIQIVNAKFQKPAFSGFTAKEIGEQTSYTSIVSGKQFDVSSISYVLIPISTGEKTIEPAVLECDIVTPRQGRRNSPFDSFFDDPFFERTTVEPRIYRTKPIRIQVKSLPPYNGKETFSGLVGQFDIQAKLDNTLLHVGDSTTLSLVINGRGNIMDAEQPFFTVPDGFKIYKDNPQENVKLDNTGYFGQKTFKIALVAIQPGKYVLPPVQLSYFDPAKNQYQIRSTPVISVEVVPATEKEPLNTYSTPESILPSPKNKVEFTGRDILPLNESLDAIENEKSLSLIFFILLLMVPAVIYLGIRGIGIVIQKEDNPSIQMAKRSEKALKNARNESKSGSSDTDNIFFTHLYRALVSGILSKAGMIGESLTYTEAEKLLCSQGYSEDLCKKAATLLERIESAKFGGYAKETLNKKDLFSETEIFIRSLSRK